MSPLVGVIVTLGMLVVLPLGLELIEPGRRLLVLAGAVPGAVSLWLEPGHPVTVWLAGLYLLATLVLAGRILPRLRRLNVVEFAACTALATPAIAAVALLAERAAIPLFGYSGQMLALTVAHFHFAGFAAALVAGLVSRLTGDVFAALAVPGGTLLVLAGYFAGDYAELAGSVVLTAGMWRVAWLSLRHVKGERVLIGVSGVMLVATMALALSWALGQATGLPHPTLGVMIATHGVGNAFGFALCSIAAWRRLRPQPL